MKKIALVAAALLAAAASFAGPRTFSPVAEAVAALAQERGESELGSSTIDDVETAVARLSIALQQEAWIHGSAMASMAMPGLGQYMNHDALGGTLYLAGGLAVKAGAMIGAWFLLPANLQVNWFTTPVGTLETAYRANSAVDYLPAVGVLAAGALLDTLLGHVSARGAVRLAEKNVLDGTKSFEPVLLTSGRGLGFGMKFRPKP
jgi:hypothetical protein